MKLELIGEVLSRTNPGESCLLTGRVSSVRNHGKIIFIDLIDSTRKVQVLLDKGSKDFSSAKSLRPGAYISVQGKLGLHNLAPEIQSHNLEVIANSTLPLKPTPWEINGLNPAYGNQVFGLPGFYIANPQRLAVLKVKTNFIQSLHNYFQRNNFTLVEPPIITDKTLYGEGNAISAKVHGERVFLSQCATFELEPLAMALGKVYTISPAFRNERAGSKRHLAEYTHAKAEVSRKPR